MLHFTSVVMSHETNACSLLASLVSLCCLFSCRSIPIVETNKQKTEHFFSMSLQLVKWSIPWLPTKSWDIHGKNDFKNIGSKWKEYIPNITFLTIHIAGRILSVYITLVWTELLIVLWMDFLKRDSMIVCQQCVAT